MHRGLNRLATYILMMILLTPLAAFAAGQVGEPAADFNLYDTNGVNHILSDHQGEVVYLFMVGYG